MRALFDTMGPSHFQSKTMQLWLILGLLNSQARTLIFMKV